MSTEISWTDEVWNCVTGCSKVSSGCKNCYAAALAPRLAKMGAKGYTDLPWTRANAPENVFLHEDRLEKPLRMTKPRRIFVNSMSDLFHEQVPDDFIDKVFAVMALAPRHTFQILTKRPERMEEYLAHQVDTLERVEMEYRRRGKTYDELPRWPLENVWLGVSVENQKTADERIPHLLRTPAAVRFLSCEPLLGAVDLTNVPLYKPSPIVPTGNCLIPDFDADHHVSWVIAGGESGPGHRPMDHDWMRKIRDACAAAGVSFFGKQTSASRNEAELPEDLKIREFPEVVGACEKKESWRLGDYRGIRDEYDIETVSGRELSGQRGMFAAKEDAQLAACAPALHDAAQRLLHEMDLYNVPPRQQKLDAERDLRRAVEKAGGRGG